MEAPGKLDVRISRVLASCMCVCTGQREPRALGWAWLGSARLLFAHVFEKKSEKGRGNLEHRAGLDWAELGWAELGLAQLSLAQLDLAHPGYFLHTCLRNKRKMPREPKALGWAGLVWATFSRLECGLRVLVVLAKAPTGPDAGGLGVFPARRFA